MSLDQLHTSKSAQFYTKVGRLSTVEIDTAFDRIAADATVGATVDRIVKKRRTVGGNNVTVSYLRFEFETEPSFLKGTNLVEKRHAYVLIAELSTLVAVFKKHVTSPIREFASKLEPISYNTLSTLFMSDDSEYERVSMRGMSVSDDTIRSRSYAAKDLKSALSPIGASRSVLSSVRVRADGEVHALTPSTSRVARSSGRSSFTDIITWALTVESEILGFANTEGFIDLFAKPMKLTDSPTGVFPNGILFTTAELENEVREEQTAKLIGISSAGNESELSAETSRLVFDRLDRGYEIEVTGNDLKFKRGKLHQNKTSFSLSSRWFDRIKVQRETDDDITLTKYLNKEQSFLVSFSEPQFVYHLRQVFEDQRLLGNIDSFLQVFDDTVDFTGVNSEKGQKTANQQRFTSNSLFRRVEKSIVQNHEIVLCDDLGDEWADHIAVNTQSPEIAFVHSKHKDQTTAASAFQDVVGQALKNLGRLFPTEVALNRKIQGWRGTWSDTNLRRIRQSNGAASIVSDILKASASPNCQRRVALAVTFLSKADLCDAFTRIKNGTSTRAHHMQLLWILSSFVNGCMEVGAKPEVYCSP
jgi:hypothetical protein